MAELKTMTIDILHVDDVLDNMETIAAALLDLLAWRGPLESTDETMEEMRSVQRIATAVSCTVSTLRHAHERAKEAGGTA